MWPSLIAGALRLNASGEFQSTAGALRLLGLEAGGTPRWDGLDARHALLLDPLGAQDRLEVGGVERALAGLIEHHFTLNRCEIGRAHV